MRRPSRPREPAAHSRPPAEATETIPRTRPARRSDGERSHREILRAAAELASVEGLEGLSIAALADHVGLSKSGLFAHFRSKQELQLETIRTAGEIFGEEVVRPALARPEGLPRLRAFVAGFFAHVLRRTFPGGCFFASVAAEVDGHPGTLRDRIASFYREWVVLLEGCVAQAKARGEVDPRADVGQVAFEVLSMLAGAHGAFNLHGDAAILDRGSRGVEAVLAFHAPKRAKGAR